MKLTKALFVLALALGLALPAHAETQNVKVSGSIDIYGFYRNNFDLQKSNDSGAADAAAAAPAVQAGDHAASQTHRSEGDSYFMGITQLEIDADLTDGVSTVVNLINQRDWNADVFDTTTANTAEEFDVILDLAYVKLKEAFYSPLTLTIGRQDLVFGRGFILGWNPQDPTTTIQADEFTQIQSFDAIRGTLDFNPWTVDLVYSKTNENSHDPEDDRDLYFTNVNYKFSERNAVAEGYFFADLDKHTTASAAGSNNNDTYTLGGRFQYDPIAQGTLGGELAYQFGNYSNAAGAADRDRGAWALDLFGEYRIENPWKPTVGIEYVYLSGEEVTASSSESWSMWRGDFRLPVYGWIHDYLELYYETGLVGDYASGQNQEHLSLYGSMVPMEDVKLSANYFYFRTVEPVHPSGLAGSSSLSKDIGHELDTALTYAYSEDVTFTFMANWFIPGSFYTSGMDSRASEYLSEVKVVF
ncbi:MAG: porin [Candidatus Omnitrophica bacterium]|nr:porin [Candidatus Omnitrophota bacterium]